MGKEHVLPVKQLTILSICRFAEPIAVSSVFPYLPEMIESFDVPSNEVAKWAGLLTASFSIAQCLTGIAWGRVSDRFGRKPIILVGMLCTMTSSLLFGFSRSLPWAMVARSLAGASSGNVGIIRTIVAEMVPYKNLQPRAFSIMPLVWTVGCIFGPAFGGALANPAARYPELFGSNRFFKTFPFALPNLVASVFFLVGLLAGFLFLKETLETKMHKRDYGRTLGRYLLRPFKNIKSKLKHRGQQASSKSSRKLSTSTFRSENAEERAARKKIPLPAPPSFREVFSPQSNINLLAYVLLALHSIAYEQLVPVFLHLRPQSNRSTNPEVQLPFKFAGGFGVDSGRIGFLFTMYGVAGMLIQFLVFPPVARHYGILKCLKACSIGFPMAYILTPFTVLLPTPQTQQLALFAVMLLKCCCSIFAFPCTTILLTNSARSLRLLGTLNGVATSLSAIGRAAGPSIGGATFTFGIGIGYMIIPWWTLAAFAALGAIPVWWLIEMEGFGDSGEADDSEDNIDDELFADEEEPDCSFSNLPSHDDMDRSSSISTISDRIAEEPDERMNDDECPIEDSPLLERMKKKASRRSMFNPSSVSSSPTPLSTSTTRRMSNPIGMSEAVRPRGERKQSTGLGYSLSGMDAGGGSCR